MEKKLVDLLKTLGFEVYKQGSFTNTGEYPKAFFTYWNDDTNVLRHYDNKENSYVWYFTIYFYSIDPELTAETLLKAKALLIKNNFIVPGKGRDVYSQSKIHFGRSIEAKIIEKGEK